MSTANVGKKTMYVEGSGNLVIVRAGPQSLHESWTLTGEGRRFDLLVAAYAPEAMRPDELGVRYVLVSGAKVAGLQKLFSDYPELVDRYERIALIDDDLETTGSKISAAFDAGEHFGLDLWQPGLTRDSYFSYAGLLSQSGSKLRYVSFIEMMCPFFSRAHFDEIKWVFGLGFETGIDVLWCYSKSGCSYKAAVLDTIAFKHTRQIGATKVQNGFSANERYDDQMEEIFRRFQVSFRGVITYCLISNDDRRISSRFSLFIRALSLLSFMPSTPMTPAVFLRAVLAHAKHCLLRKPDLSPRDLRQVSSRGQSTTHRDYRSAL